MIVPVFKLELAPLVLPPFLYQEQSDFWRSSGRLSCYGKLLGCSIPQGTMGMLCLIVLSPVLDLAAGVIQRQKPVGIQAFLAHPGVERFDEGVLGKNIPLFVLTPEVLAVAPQRA